MKNKLLAAMLLVFTSASFALAGINPLSDLQAMVGSNETSAYPTAKAADTSTKEASSQGDMDSLSELTNAFAQQANLKDKPQGGSDFLGKEGMVLVQQIMTSSPLYALLLAPQESLPTMANTVEFLVLLHEVKQGSQTLDLLLAEFKKSNDLLAELLKRSANT